MTPNILEQTDRPLVEKLGHALNRVQVAMRAESWDACGQNGLNPTQGQILLLLERHRDGLRLGEIAEELAVSAPTVSDSVSTLVAKRLVCKHRVPDDARAIVVRLTGPGRRLVGQLDSVGKTIATVLTSLPETDQVRLYHTLLRIVRELQVAGCIPLGRMCVTCRYFRPHVHAHPERPHHCALVDAAFGDRTLRSDCPEHEPADDHLANQTWKLFLAGAANDSIALTD